MKRYQASINLWHESKKYLVPSSSTLVKDPRLYPFGAFPIYITEGKGVLVKDVDGNEFIDFQSCLGANILGVAFDPLVEAMQKQLVKGTLFSLFHPMAVTLAKKICQHVPCAERVRIVKSGSDAADAAVRIARAFTGREKIAICEQFYHGWHDWYFVKCHVNRGIPKNCKENLVSFTYNDIESLRKLFREHKGQIAAVIMEATKFKKPAKGFLQAVIDVAHEHGALVIWDEVVTGFRFAFGGAQAYFGVTPDLCCFGKAISNGMPLAIVAGRGDIMDATVDVVSTTTHNEELLSIASGLATIEFMEKHDVFTHVWSLGRRFQDGYNRLAKIYNVDTSCGGYPVRFVLKFKDARHDKGYFFKETAKRGLLFGIINYITFSHTVEHIDKALMVCEEVFCAMKKAAKMPEENLPIEFFSQKFIQTITK